MNPSDLEAKIGYELDIRQHELSIARQLCIDFLDCSDQKRFQYLLRSWSISLHSHCEKFLKQCSSLYVLNFLIGNKIQSYKPELIWLLYRSTHIKENKKEQHYISFQKFHSDSHHILLDKELLKEVLKSPLQYERFQFLCDWVLQIKFPHDNFLDLCRSLTTLRNCIAHGDITEELFFERVDKIHHEIFALMSDFADHLIKNSVNLYSLSLES
jgi:hypothetical protein